MKTILNESVRNIVFIVEGGIGKNIAGTAVVRAIKKQYPNKKIIVVAGCPEVYMNNPNVKRVFNFNNPLHFYEDFIDQNDETHVMKVEPYYHYDYINKNKHVIECWCESLGVEFDGLEPDLFLTPNEIQAAQLYADQLTEKGKYKFALFQWIGGKVPQKADEKDVKVALAEMYRRSIPQSKAQEMVNFLVNEKKCKVGLVQHTNFPDLKGAQKLCFPIRAVLSLLMVCDYIVAIDSFIQHATAAKQINRKSLVIWGGTSPVCLGYPIHLNWTKKDCPTPFCHRPNSYLMDIQINGQMWDCPWGEPCMKREMSDFKTNFNQVFPAKKKKKK